MFTLTVTLTKSPHQPVLAFTTLEAANVAAEYLLSQGEAFRSVMDEFGQTLRVFAPRVASIMVVDVAKQSIFKVDMRVRELQSEHEFDMKLQKDPALKFYQGRPTPHFGVR